MKIKITIPTFLIGLIATSAIMAAGFGVAGQAQNMQDQRSTVNQLLSAGNPNGNSNVSFNLNKSEYIIIDLKNIIGQSLLTVVDKNLSPGNYDYALPVLAPGIYFVKVKGEKGERVGKFVKE